MASVVLRVRTKNGREYWQLDWTDAAGNRYRRSLGTLAELDQHQAERVRQAKAAELTFGVQILGTAPTFAEYIEQTYLPQKTAGRSADRQKGMGFDLKHAVAYLGRYPLDQLPEAALNAFVASRRAVVGSATVNKEVRMIKAVVSHAAQAKIIPQNHLRDFSPPKVRAQRGISFYSQAEIDLILKSEDPNTPTWRFMLNTGLRRGELVKARRSDIQVMPDGALILNVESIESADDDEPTGETKSGRWRAIPLNAGAREALQGLGSDRLTSLKGRTLTNYWTALRNRLGLQGGVHTLRHTFCSQLVMAGVDLRTVQVIMGHSSLQVTMRYAHLAPGWARAALDQVSQ